MNKKRIGYACLIGPTNAGKSTLLNTIFKNYEIDELLGHGIKGLAFTLKEPHENYVFKIEMHYHTGETGPGVDYPQQIMKKQEAGQYDPTQVNVLESEAFEGTEIDTTSHSETIDFYLSVMSKVEQTTYAGKEHGKWKSLYKGKYSGGMTTKDAMKDFAFSKADSLLDMSEDKSSIGMPEHTIESIAEEISKSQGNLPIEIQQLINGFVKPKPKFNYKKYISNFVGNSKQYMIGTTKLRENQRFEGAPKVILKPKSKILVCIDESGSVSENELFEFLNELHHLSKKTDIEIRPFDTKVMKPVVYKPNSGQFKRTNCGGTYFTPVIEFYNKHPEFNSMLVFTDGEAETPPPCNKKMLWVISSNGNEESIKHHNTWIKIPKD